jgi:predicted acylesterase/phospholipase RssA/CRP-like cAMP-binding protein
MASPDLILDVRATLASCPLLADATPEAIDWLAERAQPLTVHGGETLLTAGSPPNELYIVAAGRLRAQLPDGRIAGEIVRLEPVGEIGLISGEPRHAAVFALRDSLLLKISGADWLQFLEAHPTSLLAVTRVIIQRMRQNQREAVLGGARAAQTLAILPARPGPAARQVAQDLAQALSAYAPTHVIDAQTVDAALGAGSASAQHPANGDSRLLNWLSSRESEHQYLIFLADDTAGAWTQRCLRQADRVLVVAGSNEPPVGGPTLDLLRQMPLRAPIELVLLRPESASAGDVMAWRARTQARAHFFLRPRQPADIAAIARQLSGRGVGVVLGGGGARGFAHIGLIRALEELHIPVDLAGGTSMGAFFGALLAAGYNSRDMLRIARDTFVTHNFLNDYLLPRIALIRGRKFLQRLHSIFGDARVEELRLPYFCVSTNLTRGAAVMHDAGPLYLWIATSMSVPGIAPPLVWHGDLLADGAVLNSLPTDIMQGLARGPIIASDVSREGGPHLDGVEGPDPEALLKVRNSGISMVDILFRTATLTSESGVRARAERADLYLRMPVSNVALFDWKRMDEIVQRSYETALQALSQVRDRLVKGHTIT